MVTADERGPHAARPAVAMVHGIDVARVEAAIRAAELATSAELRVSIARLYFWGDTRRSAERIFRRLHMERTRRRNGLLIFVSPWRRRFEILCDTGIHPHVPAAVWEQLAAGLGADFRAGDRTGGLERVIAAAAAKLAGPFPPEPPGTSVDELPNEVAR
jgi:uncharacterized membrane protein